MALSYKATIRAAMLDAITTAAGNAALLQIYDSTGTGKPATAGGAVTTQQKLVQVTLGTPFAGAASATVDGAAVTLTLTDPASVNTAIAGTATWFRIVKADTTTFVMDGTVSTIAAGTGDLQLSNTTLILAQPVDVGSFVISEANI